MRRTRNAVRLHGLRGFESHPLRQIMNAKQITEFQSKIWTYYKNDGRHDLPWRKTHDQYKILVSEVMLQQTQISRVIVKYKEFIKALPNFESLAQASLGQVLELWQGLGYNRRAVNLHKLARIVLENNNGKLPNDPAELIKLPGIGKGTAGSIAAFVFNSPTVFIETNIRRVYIAEFFPIQTRVGDNELLPLIEQTLDHNQPRIWYWALMDYGAHLATQGPNPNRASRHYNRQSRFAGSHRQLRGLLVKYFVANKKADLATLKRTFADVRLKKALDELVTEGFIVKRAQQYKLR